MANLQEQSVWETGIYQLETSDPVLAGPDGVDNLQGKQLANRTAYLKDRVEELASGKQPAGNAVKLSAARNIAMSGDGSWNVAFDGSKDVSGQLTLRDSGVAPGSYGMVTVDAKGRVTAARQMSGDDVPAHDWSKVATGKPTTLAGYGIADGASKTDLQNAVNGLVSGAPANLNTLQELAAAVNNDPKYSATVDGKLAGKADKATTLAGYGIADGASKSDLKAAVDGLVSGAPGALNTLQELAAALGNDANYAASMTKLLAGKADKATTLSGYGIADAASADDLAKVAARVNSRRMIRVRAGGYSAKNGVAGVEIDGVGVGPVARSYNMVQLDAAGAVSRSATFDVCGGNGQDKAAADWLNAAPDGATVIVYTWDEPQGNRLTGGLPQALYRCGASSAVFASDKFQYRSAYLLIGRAGCGEGQGLERYCGDKPASPDAQLDVAFELVNGMPLLGGGQVSGAAAPTGQVAYFSMPNAPDGWLKANGAQVSQSTYGNLYAAIGQTFAPIDPATQAMLRLDAADTLLDRVWNKQLVVYGGTDMSTEQAKFGGASLKTVAGGGYATFGLTDAFNADAFTIEGWHYPTFAGTGNSNGYSAAWLVSMNASAVTGEITIAIDRASRAPLVWLCNSGSFFANASLGTAGVFNSPRWYHVALSYDGAAYRLFVDGVQVWSLVSATRVAIPDNTLVFGVDGGAPGVAGSTTAYYQDWKISKVCRYAGNFAVPTIPTGYQLAPDAGKFYLPNLCGEFIRGWGDSRKDVEKRAFGSWQKGTLAFSDPNLDSIAISAPIHTTNINQDAYQDLGADPVSKAWYQMGRAYVPLENKFAGDLDAVGFYSGYGSTRPRNVALLACVKY
ncbi:tail fiber protein [Chromobacterium violaceum]|uniref:tail fiber protein n=1 Tax=Chromobacterium violaceum TaxID=536 RepID=UPI00069E9484|nr:tail fiber protein [Chromobacterium violaceum]